MATIKKFEDLEVWKQAREFNKEIFKITNYDMFSRDFGLKDQIRRAAGSVMDNIAEGFEREGNKEFRQYLYISKVSNGEVRSQLYRALDFNYIKKEEFDQLYHFSSQLGVLLHNFISYLSSSPIKGQKYKPSNISNNTSNPLNPSHNFSNPSNISNPSNK